MKRLQVSRLVVALCVVCLSGSVLGQGPTPGSVTPRRDTAKPATTGAGKIRGRVVAATANTPIRRAQMVLSGVENPELRRIAQTDAEGRYEFSDLPVGRYSLVASAGGYVALQFGQRRPTEGGTPVALREAETITSIDFALPRGSVIAGRVTDEFGQPLVQAQVAARRFRYTENGQRTLVLVSNPPAVTDDRGEFRIFGLMPGEYIVDASLRSISSLTGAAPNPNSFLEGFQPTYYPGTPSAADAQPISLGVGQERNIQIAVTGARLVQVGGVVRDSQDRPIFAQVQMWTRMADLSTPFSVTPGGSTSVTTNADGSFAFQGVLPGDYVLEVRNRVPGALGPQPAPEAGFLPVTVRGGDVTGLRIMTSSGSAVSGTVVWEGSSPRGQAVRVTAQTADSVAPGTIMVGDVDDSGNFRVGGVRGRVYLNVPGSANWNWTVKSVTFAGQDVTDIPLDLTDRPNLDGVRITMTDRLSSLSGHVTDTGGKPVTQYVVVIQPTDQKEPRVAARFIRTGRPDIDGRFELRNVRPGRYVATAVEALEDGRQFSSEFQKELRRGAREFTLKEGETLSLDLRLTTGL